MIVRELHTDSIMDPSAEQTDDSAEERQGPKWAKGLARYLAGRRGCTVCDSVLFSSFTSVQTSPPIMRKMERVRKRKEEESSNMSH